MSIHYRQYTDTFSILNQLQNHIVCGEINGQKLVLYYLENSKLPTKFVDYITGESGQRLLKYYIHSPQFVIISIDHVLVFPKTAVFVLLLGKKGNIK